MCVIVLMGMIVWVVLLWFVYRLLFMWYGGCMCVR